MHEQALNESVQYERAQRVGVDMYNDFTTSPERRLSSLSATYELFRRIRTYRTHANACRHANARTHARSHARISLHLAFHLGAA